LEGGGCLGEAEDEGEVDLKGDDLEAENKEVTSSSSSSPHSDGFFPPVGVDVVFDKEVGVVGVVV